MDNNRTIKITYPDDDTMSRYNSAQIYNFFNFITHEQDAIIVAKGDVILSNDSQIYYYDELIEDEDVLNEFRNLRMIDLDVDTQIDIQIKKFTIRNKKNLRTNGTSFIKIDDNKYIKYEGIVG